MNRLRCFRYCVYACVFGLLVFLMVHLDMLTNGPQETAVTALESRKMREQSLYHSDPTSLESRKIREQSLYHSDPTLMIDDSAARQLARRPGGRILCWVPAAAKNIASKVATVNATWLRRCDGHVFFIEGLPPPVPPDVVSLDVPPGYYNLTAKVTIILQYLYTTYLDQYDWFLKGDDDAYVIVENLRYLTSRYNASEPVYLGHLYKRYHKEGFMSGGATYVLSRPALKMIVENGYHKNKCRTKGGAEDVEVGRCAHAAGVHSHNSRDKLGRDTFHPLRPTVHIAGPIPADQLPQDRFLMVSGPECCSQLTISFHKVDPPLMKVMDHLLYRTSVYGHVQDVGALQDLIEPEAVPPLP